MPPDDNASNASRYIVLFLIGRFTLEEANRFAVDLFDEGEVPNGYHYFNVMPGIRTVGITAKTPPDELQYLFNHFPVMEHLDEYTFFLTCHIAETFFRVNIKDALLRRWNKIYLTLMCKNKHSTLDVLHASN